MLFAIRIKDALNVTVQRSHDADSREHRWAAKRRYQDQGLHCRLPFCRRVLCLRNLCDVGASVFEGDELATIGQRDWSSMGKAFQRRHMGTRARPATVAQDDPRKPIRYCHRCYILSASLTL